MALVRYDYYWANNLSTDATTNRPNREAPPPEVKNSGLKNNQPEAYEWYNYQHWIVSQGLFQIEDEYTAADATLQSNIDQEQSDRENADIDLQQQIDALEQAIIQKIYPVGAYYVTENSVNPATQLGFGTWVEVVGKVLVGQDTGDSDFDTIGEEGGNKTHSQTATSTTTTNTTVDDHVLTVSEMPSHAHRLYGTNTSSASVEPLNGNVIAGDSNGTGVYTNSGLGGNQLVEDTGGDQGHNHTASSTSTTNTTVTDGSSVQPYRVVHMWRRTA